MSKHSRDRLVAGIELGGTKAIVLLARGRDIVDQARFPTGTPDETLAAVADWLVEATNVHGQPAALGIGSFGPLCLDRSAASYGHIVSTPKAGWQNTSIAGYFRSRFGWPIAIDTDVAGAALAEYRWGAGQDCETLVYMTIGTGLGGGVLIRGEPIHGLIHPELGHVRVRRRAGDGFAGVCPFHGDCLEGLVSGPALAARTGIRGDSICGDHRVWDDVASELAEAIAMVFLVVSPQRILIGGGVPERRGHLLAAVRTRVALLLNGYLGEIRDAAALRNLVCAPGLGAMAGPLGSIALAYRALDIEY